MNSLFMTIILVSFVVSIIASIVIMKKKQHKYIALAVAFGISAFILVAATPVVYSMDNQIFENQTNRFFESLGIYTLIYFIPLVTLVNFCLIHLLDKKEGEKEEETN
ncbi:hypothetical protein [Alkalihalobacillus sp. 1P02AB]|uniref:hypothetical protein n=1 Tax=Alkalihalobacillus sp. 1P02AB TaxID=3132260 RepID=UPI0039A54450